MREKKKKYQLKYRRLTLKQGSQFCTIPASKPVQIPPLFHTGKNTGYTGEYRSFWAESKNRPVQTAS